MYVHVPELPAHIVCTYLEVIPLLHTHIHLLPIAPPPEYSEICTKALIGYGTPAPVFHVLRAIYVQVSWYFCFVFPFTAGDRSIATANIIAT